jgi:transposase-like protein
MARVTERLLKRKTEVTRTARKFELATQLFDAVSELERRVEEQAPELHLDLNLVVEEALRGAVTRVNAELDELVKERKTGRPTASVSAQNGGDRHV